MKMNKKILSAILGAALVACLAVPAAFATGENAEEPLVINDAMAVDANVAEKEEALVEGEAVEPAEKKADRKKAEVKFVQSVRNERAGLTVKGELPAGASLEVETVEENAYSEEALDACDGELLFALDIAPVSGNEGWQPADGEIAAVTLDASKFDLEDGAKIAVVHDGEEGCEYLGEYVVSDGKLDFETEGFSDFYFYLIFEYNGYSFTLSGGGEVYLSEIFTALEIKRPVGEVVGVDFSDESLMRIEQIEDDWLLTSLEPFGTEEVLTVEFFDGEIIKIGVTDPVIYNYAVGRDITNVPLLATQDVTVGSVTDGDKYAEGRTYKSNSVVITADDVTENGTTTKPAASTIHMRIYVKPGMAVRFGSNVYFTNDGAHPNHDEGNAWFWAWDGTSNYVIAKEGTAPTMETFLLQVDSVAKAYCNVQLVVVEEAEDLASGPVLLEDVIGDAGDYSIKSVPVTLYDYDGKAWNEYYDSKGGNYFAFAGTVEGDTVTDNAPNRGWTISNQQVNGGGSSALMGIVKDELVNGLPVMSQGQQVDLFTKASNSAIGKTVYNNVGFQFVYNESTGYYSYNAALNHAQFNSSKNEIQLYKQSLSQADIPTGGTSQHGNAGFYPFADIEKSFTNPTYQELSWDDWAKALKEDTFSYRPSTYATDIVDSTSKDPLSTAKLHYGLQVDSQFYMPKGKKLNNEDLVYKFTGDDDLWVFIDGNLVLDIGGGHTHVSGSFNLTTGEVWVGNYSKLAESDGGSYETGVYAQTDLRETSEFLQGLEDDQMHRIQIFYLERHAGVSNCKMHFNLPLVPADTVEVSKSLDLAASDGRLLKEDITANADNADSYDDEDYTFQVFTAAGTEDKVDAPESSFEPLRNAEYLVGDDVCWTDGEGKFTLKAGQTAFFLNIPRFTEVYAIELTPDGVYDYADGKAKVSVNGGAETSYTYGTKTETKVMQMEQSISFAFANVMLAQDLKITKSGILPVDDDAEANGDIAPEDAEYQSTLFNVVGPDGFSMDLAVCGNDSVIIKDLIPGIYTVSEKTSWSWRYAPECVSQEVSLTNEMGLADFNNERVKGLWLSGDNIDRNVFSAIQ